MKTHEEGFSMPVAAPAYEGPPYWGRPEGDLLVVFYYTDKNALEWEVPEPLELAPDPMIIAWIGDLSQPRHTQKIYNEALTMIRVKYKEITGWYVNYLWTTHDQSLMFCREVYGWPAQLCDPDQKLRFDGSVIMGDCVRNGVRLMRIILNVTSPPPVKLDDHLKDRFDQDLKDRFGKLMGKDFIQFKKIPSMAEGRKPLRQISHHVEDATIHEIWRGNASVELAKSGYYPNLYRLNPTEIVDAFYVRSEWIVPYATILWEDA
jgi:acetoacetate decarboxylase